MDWTANIATLGAIALGAFHLIAYYIHVRAILRATPEQLEELKKIEPPKFLRSRGPALFFFAIGTVLALAPRVAEYRTMRAIERRNEYLTSRRWSCSNCQELPPIGDFRTDSRGEGLPVYHVRN